MDRESAAEIERLTRILSATPSVERVILFGSHASGRARAASDIDLIVVQRTDHGFLDRLGELYRLLLPQIDLDLLVYTPDEFERLVHERRFVRDAVRTGRELYRAA